MLQRDAAHIVKHLANKLPVVALLGPRQSGKTTLARAIFGTYRYINFEDLNQRSFALSDPKGFLADAVYNNQQGVILDEAQHVPQLLSYIQLYVDTHEPKGYFILTASQNFLLRQAISQSLAGRIAIITLQPLSLYELQVNKIQLPELNSLLLKGTYPRLYSQELLPKEFYPFYIQTYIERDVRQMINIENLNTFQRFLKLCAGRIGQLLNVSSLANDCGINTNTAKAWISLLEASYIIYLLQPYYKNFSKRLIKSPKLYFYDSGIATTLLGVQSEQDLATHYLRGNLVESFVITELAKHFFNKAETPPLYFWRDSNGNEVDCIVEQGACLNPVEIKSGQTISSDYFEGLHYWSKLTTSEQRNGFVVYGGNETQHRSQGTVLSWQAIDQIINKT